MLWKKEEGEPDEEQNRLYIVPGRCLGPQAINQQINRIKVEDCIATLRRELLVFYLFYCELEYW